MRTQCDHCHQVSTPKAGGFSRVFGEESGATP